MATFLMILSIIGAIPKVAEALMFLWSLIKKLPTRKERIAERKKLGAYARQFAAFQVSTCGDAMKCTVSDEIGLETAINSHLDELRARMNTPAPAA